jgi:predicted dehydrogenase
MGRVMRVGVAGAGYFGRFHAQKVAQGARSVLAGVHDPDAGRAAALAAEMGCAALGWEALLAASEAVVIASPAAAHFEAAAAALRAGKHVLVEKPLATDATLGAELVAIAAANTCVLACGHQERLVFEAMGLFDAPERPTRIESVREGPWTGRSADVSVTLDLMVHDLDLALKLMGRSADRVTATAHAEHGKAADAIEATLGFGDAEAVFTSSRIAADRKRTMRAVYPSGEIRIDFLARTFENTTSFPLNAAFAETRIGADPLGANVSIFIDAVLGVAPRPVVNGEEALAVLKLALDVDRASGLASLS